MFLFPIPNTRTHTGRPGFGGRFSGFRFPNPNTTTTTETGILKCENEVPVPVKNGLGLPTQESTKV
jgi:hypothetical protein